MNIKYVNYLGICLVLFQGLYACSGKTESGSKENENPATERTEQSGTEKSSGKDPRSIGGEKSAFQLEIDKASMEIRKSDNPLLGYWVGDFGNNKINITLSNIKGNEIKGHSVCAGNYRPISGTIENLENGNFKIAMEEPGNDRYDGKFEFEINAAKTELEGSWKPFKAEGNQAKKYKLTKKEFIYDPKAGEFPQTSTRRLKEADVENLTAEKLKIMRNEIYARHGYSFKEKDMRRYFEKKSWYVPVGIDIRDLLTELELENIDLIYTYEEYYDTNYDSYGR